MRLFRPHGVLAGFHAEEPDPAVPELQHLGEQWLPMSTAIGSHVHVVWELYLQLDGRSLWQANDRHFELTSGQFYAAPPGLDHQLVTRPTGHHHYVFLGVHLGPVLARLPAIAACWQRRDFIHLTAAESLEQPFRQVVREAVMQQPFRSEGLRMALDAVVIEASRLLSSGSRGMLATEHPAVAKARNLMENHPGQPWRLSELGRMVGLSPNHLVTLFTRDVGVSPHQHLVRVRIERAKHQLATTDASVTEMALELGFSSSQHFARAFRQIARMSARAWRARHHPGAA